MKSRFLILISLFIGFIVKAQTSDSTINNLIHNENYKPSELNSIPKYVKVGKGKQNLILIPGIGFDASVFSDFMNANKHKYTMYAITIAGFGNTTAPAMPPEGTSYSEQTWSKSTINGILKLIDKEKISKPTIVGHFTLGTQIALRLAIDNPDKISKVVILGGQAKFIAIMKGEVKDMPLDYLIVGTDKYTAPRWYKTISKKDFDEGNYLPEIYSLDSIKGKELCSEVAEVPLPVMVRYLCEYQASDLKAELSKIKCPTLIIRPKFNKSILDDTFNNYVSPQFIESWNNVSESNALIQVKDLENSSTFVWKDQSKLTYEIIDAFLGK